MGGEAHALGVANKLNTEKRRTKLHAAAIYCYFVPYSLRSLIFHIIIVTPLAMYIPLANGKERDGWGVGGGGAIKNR